MTPPVTSPAAVPPGPAKSRRGGWWRRNWWGLLAVPPVLAATMWLHPNQPFQHWYHAEPRAPVVAGADGWVEYAGARLRLDEFAPAALVERDGSPYQVPDGLQAWQATITIAPVADPDALGGCSFDLEDTQGRVVSDAPDVLLGAGLPDQSRLGAQCAPFDDEGEAAGAFQTTAVFVLSAAARPAAVRVILPWELPAYARLSVR